MLPKHGFCYGVLLLARAATLSPRQGVDDWVAAVRMHGSFLAAAIDLKAPATMLVDSGLARIGQSLELSAQLTAATDCRDADALLQVARLLLITTPPAWLRMAVNHNVVARQYIPTNDLDSLRWLEPNLDRVLIEAYDDRYSSEHTYWQKQIGVAAELFVLAALRYSGLKPAHVALISDVYGYDIEVRDPLMDRIEVKGAGPRTALTFHLSRNEFEKSQQHAAEWRLLQVVFHSSAFADEELDHSHIESVYELDSQGLRQTIPPDPTGFVWEKSALVTPPRELWRSSGLTLDPSFRMPGFGSA
ncbi:protein NO VEIN domain-containing protein [Nocardia colli]|uniref:protein NO VEIN domain-containing protein n=1 Tax=Nocardia colli TaxID=2545717 RepID=UPI0035DC2D5D